MSIWPIVKVFTGEADCMSPRPLYCSEKNRLLEEYTRAVSDFLRMQSAKIAALVRGGEVAFEADLEKARKRKHAAKEAIQKHQRKHRC